MTGGLTPKMYLAVWKTGSTELQNNSNGGEIRSWELHIIIPCTLICNEVTRIVLTVTLYSPSIAIARALLQALYCSWGLASCVKEPCVQLTLRGRFSRLVLDNLAWAWERRCFLSGVLGAGQGGLWMEVLSNVDARELKFRSEKGGLQSGTSPYHQYMWVPPHHQSLLSY